MSLEQNPNSKNFLQGEIYYKNFPIYCQMTGGTHRDNGLDVIMIIISISLYQYCKLVVFFYRYGGVVVIVC